MKKIKLILAISIVAFTIGCEDAIDIKQPGLLTSDAAIQSVTDIEDALIGAYGNLDTTPENYFSSVFTDEIRIAFSTGGQGRSLYQHNLNSGSTMPSVVWTRSYVGINRANRIIEAAELIEAGDAGEQAREDNALGQAYAIRAYLHLRLLSFMSEDLSDDSSLGIPLVDFVPPTDFAPLRNTTGEVFDAIYTDLDLARGLITDSSVDVFTVNGATALKARAAAYRGDYGTAQPLAQAALNATPLADTSSYQNMFADIADGELIFKLERNLADPYNSQGSTGSSAAGGWAGASYAFSGPGLAGGPYFEVATNLWFAYDAADVRRSIIGDENIAVPAAGRDVYLVNKYPGSDRPLLNDLKVIRSSEMALILAEAEAATDPAAAAAFVDQVRDARYGSDQATPVYNTPTEAWAGILDERRVEFAFEGHRYLDLRRLGSLGNVTIDRADMDCAPFGACDLTITDFRWTLPLPLSEFNGNPGLRDQQNSGY